MTTEPRNHNILRNQEADILRSIHTVESGKVDSLGYQELEYYAKEVLGFPTLAAFAAAPSSFKDGRPIWFRAAKPFALGWRCELLEKVRAELMLPEGEETERLRWYEGHARDNPRVLELREIFKQREALAAALFGSEWDVPFDPVRDAPWPAILGFVPARHFLTDGEMATLEFKRLEAEGRHKLTGKP